jgi:hypothetical protein
MVACRLRTECKLPVSPILALGYRNELFEVFQCVVTLGGAGNPDICRSAARREDADDNRQGATYPMNVRCEERCTTIQGNKRW